MLYQKLKAKYTWSASVTLILSPLMVKGTCTKFSNTVAVYKDSGNCGKLSSISVIVITTGVVEFDGPGSASLWFTFSNACQYIITNM